MIEEDFCERLKKSSKTISKQILFLIKKIKLFEDVRIVDKKNYSSNFMKKIRLILENINYLIYQIL